MKSLRAWPLLLVGASALLLHACGDSTPSDERQRQVKARQAALAAAHQPPDRTAELRALEKILPLAETATGVDAEAIAAVRDTLAKERDDTARAAAIRVLGACRDRTSLAAIAAHANSSEPQVRMESVVALTLIDATAATSVLTRGFDDGDDSVRIASAQGLARTVSGVATLIAALPKGGASARIAMSGLASSSLPAAHAAVASAIEAPDSDQRIAAIQAAGAQGLRSAIPALVAIVAKPQRPAGPVYREAVQSLASFDDDAAAAGLLPLLDYLRDPNAAWAKAAITQRRVRLQPLLLDEIAKPARSEQLLLLWTLLADNSDAEAQARVQRRVAESVAPTNRDIVEIASRLAKAAPDVRELLAARLRSAATSAMSAAQLRALSFVGVPGDGPDGQLALNTLRNAGGNAALRSVAAESCGRLRVTAAAPIFRSWLASSTMSLRIAGAHGVIALNNGDGLDAVNALLLSGTIDEGYPLLRGALNGDQHPGLLSALYQCRDPRILPGLTRWLREAPWPDVREACFMAVAANGTSEAAQVLMNFYADPAVPHALKRDVISAALSRMRSANRPVTLRTMRTAPISATGANDVGWWSAELLREQGNDAVSDILAAFDEDKPQGPIAARFVVALSQASDPRAIAMILEQCASTDRKLAGLAMTCLVKARRATPDVIAKLTALHTAAQQDPGWQSFIGDNLASLRTKP